MHQWPRSRFVLVGILIALQVIDFVFTWRLLAGGSRTDVYEANPLAQLILSNGGWAGLALFKGCVTAVALAAVLWVSRWRPRTAQRLLLGLCLMVLVVVGQGGRLLAMPAGSDASRIKGLQEHEGHLSDQMKAVSDFKKARDTILIDMVEGRIDPVAAVARTVACINAHRAKLDSFQKKHLPSTDHPHHVASYAYFHAIPLAKGRGRQAELVILGKDLAEYHPGMVLIEPGTLHSFELPWRQ